MLTKNASTNMEAPRHMQNVVAGLCALPQRWQSTQRRCLLAPFAKVALLVALLLLLSEAAFAQKDRDLLEPPVVNTVDDNAVDLATGQLARTMIAQPVISMGASTNYDEKGANELTSRLYSIYPTGYGINDIAGSGLKAVSAGPRSYLFYLNGANARGGAETLASSSTTATLTEKDGSVTNFSFAGYQGYSGYLYSGLLVDSVTRPNGEKFRYIYQASQYCPGYPSSCTVFAGLKLIYSNRGYGLYFGGPAAAVGINLAVDSCNLTTGACSAIGANRPQINTVSSGIPNVNLPADVRGKTYNFTPANSTDPSLEPATLITSTGTDNVTYRYEPYGQVGSGVIDQVTKKGQNWRYSVRGIAFGDYGAITGEATTIVTDPNGNSKTFVADPTLMLVKSVKDELNRLTTYQYDSQNRLQTKTDPEGNKTVISYDARGNVTEIRLVSKTPGSPADIVTSAAYPTTCANPKTCNKPTSTTDAKGNVTDYTYDPTHGGILSVTRPAPTLGGVRPQERYTYAARQAYYKNSAGAIVASGENIYVLTGVSTCKTLASCAGGADEIKKVIDYGPQTAGTANNLLPVSVSTGSGDGSLTATTSYTYDAVGNKISEDGPLPGTDDTTRYAYDAARQVTATIGADPDGTGPRLPQALSNTYNTDSQLTIVERGTVTNPTDTSLSSFNSLERTVATYDGYARNVKMETVAGGVTYKLTQKSYDALGRLECSAVRMNPAAYSSLPASACTLGTQGSGASDYGQDRITKLAYDAASQLTKTIAAFGTADQADQETNTYTSNGRLATVTDGENNRTTFEYDGHDRLFKTRYPIATVGGLASSTTDYEQLTFDANGNVTQHRKRDGQLVNFTYDALNRQTAKDLPNIVAGEYDTTTAYDNLGRPTTVNDTANNFVGAAYDALGRMTTQSSPSGAINMAYDLAGRLTRVTHPDNVYFDYVYNTTDLTNIRDGAGTNLVTYSYDNLGRRTQIGRGAVVASPVSATPITYDPIGRLASYTQDLAGTANDLAVNGLTYNSASQLTSITRTNPTDLYAWTAHYNINRPYGTNGLNQLTSAGATALGYDGRGNLVSSGNTTYGYTSENRLATSKITYVCPPKTSCQPSPTFALYYDPTGRLSRVTGNFSSPTKLDYLGPRLIIERDGSNSNNATNILRRYVHGPGDDEPVVWYEGAGTAAANLRYLHTDERGSVIATSDSAGTSTATIKYDEYGIPQSTTALTPAAAGRFMYTGQTYIPELGLYYYKARFYSSTLGRFMQTDPIGYKDGVNWYAYVGSDPINKADATGLRDIYIGGMSDKDSTRLVQNYADAQKGLHPQRDIRYFGWTEMSEIISAIKAPRAEGEPLNVIGHSMGGSSAIIAVNRAGVNVTNLITVDPVGKSGKAYDGSKAPWIEYWANIEARPKGFGNFSDVIAREGEEIFGYTNTAGADAQAEVRVSHGDFEPMMERSKANNVVDGEYTKCSAGDTSNAC